MEDASVNQNVSRDVFENFKIGIKYVPDDLAGQYPGCGGKENAGQSAMKFFCRFEATSGEWINAIEGAGKHPIRNY